MHFAKQFIRRTLQKAGVDVVPYPLSDWTRSRHVLQTVLDKQRINCVLDVGANEGQYGSQLRLLGYRGRIVSFEPVRTSFEVLSKTSREYRGSWRVFQYALGSSAGAAEINVTLGADFSSFLTPREDSLTRFPNNRVQRTEVVQIKRLDDIISDCIDGIDSQRLYLKLDTQGYDLEVLKGAERSLSQIAALQMEISFKPIYHNMSIYNDSVSALMALGFDVFDFMPVTRDQNGLGAIEMDCVMIRAERDSMRR